MRRLPRWSISSSEPSPFFSRSRYLVAAIKSSFHARHNGVAGLSRVALDLATPNYYRSDESKELGRAFAAREKPDRKKFYR